MYEATAIRIPTASPPAATRTPQPSPMPFALPSQVSMRDCSAVDLF